MKKLLISTILSAILGIGLLEWGVGITTKPAFAAFPTFTPTNTGTPTGTPTFTRTFTSTSTPSFTPTFTPTFTPSFTPTFTPSFTSTFTPTFTGSNTPTITFTPTFTPTFTLTFTRTLTVTKTFTTTFTPTFTQTNTPTPGGVAVWITKGQKSALVDVNIATNAGTPGPVSISSAGKYDAASTPAAINMFAVNAGGQVSATNPLNVYQSTPTNLTPTATPNATQVPVLLTTLTNLLKVNAQSQRNYGRTTQLASAATIPDVNSSLVAYATFVPSFGGEGTRGLQLEPGDYTRIGTTPRGSITTFATGFSYTPAAAPTDTLFLFGTTNDTIEVTYLELWATATSLAVVSELDAILIMRQSLTTGGTAVTIAGSTFSDTTLSNQTLCNGFVNYTANPTPGTTSPITINRKPLYPTLTAANTYVPPPCVLWDATSGVNKPLKITTGTQGLAVNLNGATLPAGCVIKGNIIWQEYNSTF